MDQPDPNTLVDLTTCASAFEAEVIRNALVQSGIYAFAATTVGWMNPWRIASSMPLRVQVRRCDMLAAERELAATREEARGIDWNLQDLGEPEAGELAAQGPGDGDWKTHHEEKRTVAEFFLRIGYMTAFGPMGIVTVFIGLFRKKGGEAPK